MPNDIQSELASVDDAKKGLDETYAKMRGSTGGTSPATASPAPSAKPTKKWTVTMKDGTVYKGVVAPDAKTASQKMMTGPQGPLAAPQRTPPGQMNWTGLSDVAKSPAALAGPLGVASLVGDIASPSKPPTSGRELAGDIVPLLAGLIPGGRTLGRFGRTLGANVLGRGAVEAGAEMASPEGRGPLSAGLSGAVKGILPGLVQGGVGAILGPAGGTLQVQKAAKALKAAVSPELAKLIDPAKPAQMLSRNTVRQMNRAAGANLDKMETSVEKALGPDFRVGGTSAPNMVNLPPEVRQALGYRRGEPSTYATGGQTQTGGQTFTEIRAKIKELRTIGDKQYTSPEMRDTAKTAMRDAARLEETLLKSMPPALAAQYKKATIQHASDMDAIRWVRGQQQKNKVAGGANPIDRPKLATAEKAMNRAQGGAGKAMVHGGLAALEAATGRVFGAGYQGARAAEGLRGSGPLQPGNPSQTIPAITRGVLGLGTAQAQKPLMPPSEAQ